MYNTLVVRILSLPLMAEAHILNQQAHRHEKHGGYFAQNHFWDKAGE